MNESFIFERVDENTNFSYTFVHSLIRTRVGVLLISILVLTNHFERISKSVSCSNKLISISYDGETVKAFITFCGAGKRNIPS